MTPCTVWRPRPGARVNPRADVEELRQTCERDYTAEERLLDALREQIYSGFRSAALAIGKQSKVLEEDRPLVRCPHCLSRFVAWRISHGEWATRCRRCASKGKAK